MRFILCKPLYLLNFLIYRDSAIKSVFIVYSGHRGTTSAVVVTCRYICRYMDIYVDHYYMDIFKAFHRL